MEYPFELVGKVTPYSGNGRKLGYPTANIACLTDSPEGVFVGYTNLEGKKRPSVIFIGAPETFNETNKRAESYILDFPDRDLYGLEIKLTIVKKLRDNRKFGSKEELIVQMQADEELARRYFTLLRP